MRKTFNFAFFTIEPIQQSLQEYSIDWYINSCRLHQVKVIAGQLIIGQHLSKYADKFLHSGVLTKYAHLTKYVT